MKLQPRDKRALILLASAVALMLIVRLAMPEDSAPPVVAPADTVDAAARRLAQAQQTVAAIPGKQSVLRQLSDSLAERDKSVMQAETAAQAQERVLQIVRTLANQQGAPFSVRSEEIGPVRPYGAAYGEAVVSVSFSCQIEQLLNLMADLTRQPEAISTRELRIIMGDPKEKLINARVTFAGLVPRRLVPEKKGAAAL